MPAPACAVLTLSDTRTLETDVSGQTLQKMLTEAGYRVVAYRVIPDEGDYLRAVVKEWCAEPGIHAIVITGSTGVGPRDIAPETLQPLFTKPLPGFGELFRMLSWEQVGSRALSSRATAGIVGTTLIFSLPGSTRAVKLAMEKLILPELLHLVGLVRGEGHVG